MQNSFRSKEHLNVNTNRASSSRQSSLSSASVAKILNCHFLCMQFFYELYDPFDLLACISIVFCRKHKKISYVNNNNGFWQISNRFYYWIIFDVMNVSKCYYFRISCVSYAKLWRTKWLTFESECICNRGVCIDIDRNSWLLLRVELKILQWICCE